MCMTRTESLGSDEMFSEERIRSTATQILEGLSSVKSSRSTATAAGEEEDERKPGAEPLYVIMFVTIVGWGKNEVCRGLGAQGARLADELGVSGRWVILEGDTLKNSFWPQVSTCIRDPSLRLLILNRNFPPNSWEPSVRKLHAASHGKRLLVPVAVVPKSVGTLTSPWSLLDLAVCLKGVQGRTGHGTQLDESNMEAAHVTAKFYDMYNRIGGWHDLLDKVRT